MAHTRAWDETSPDGSDLVSSLDDTIKEKLVDVREREALDHVWNSSTTHDGKHKRVTLRPADDTDEIVSESAASTTGSGVTGWMNLARTLNTSGHAILAKFAVTNTASGASSKFLSYLVDAVEKFYIDLQGVFTKITLRAYREKIVTVSISSNTLTLDLATGNIFKVSLNANITTVTLQNAPTDSTSFTIVFTNDGTVRTINGASAFGSATFRWPGGAVPTPTGTNNKIDVFSFIGVDGAGTEFLALNVGQNH